MDNISDKKIRMELINWNVYKIMFHRKISGNIYNKYLINKATIKGEIHDLLKEELNLDSSESLPKEVANLYCKLFNTYDKVEECNDINFEKENKEVELCLRELCNIIENEYNKPNYISSVWFEKLHFYYNSIRLSKIKY